MEHLHIGSRIQVGKDRATILFIGSITGTKGEWLGIEWDDPNRGKHNGTHQDKHYFDCRYPTSGSFIRFHPEKVQTGRSFMDALKDRYLDDIDTTATYDKNKDKSELYWGGNKDIVVETYGFEKIMREQQQLGQLKVVGLAEQLVANAGNENEIDEAELTMEDVDLSRNLLSDWETIESIVSQLPKLQKLRLNQNRLLSPIGNYQLNHLHTLALSSTNITWKDVSTLAKSLNQLQDLQLGYNHINVDQPIHLPHLKCLNLEHNCITDWSYIMKLDTPNLETLFLNDNEIKTIITSTQNPFQKLTYLRLERNKINDWSSLDALDAFTLDHLRCKENHIFKDMDKEVELSHIVGRISSITTVNGNTLTPRERTDFERYYLIHCSKQGETHDSIGKQHPRYLELCKKHGEPDIGASKKREVSTLKDRLITIHITLRPIDELKTIQSVQDLPPVAKSITKRFIPTMTIRNVKHMIQKLLKISAVHQQLYLTDETRVMDISDDLRDLKFYGIKENDEIVVIVEK
ncbi:hypothetical protein K501DRAFT_324212 [Backusella circina FSU 941]|nr:hypothetical protein K501DRAFT_324212 [Backusella circina FSU 941]